jgi:hypothetical protein
MILTPFLGRKGELRMIFDILSLEQGTENLDRMADRESVGRRERS